MGTLEHALALAAAAHAGQTDKAEQPYILHPIRVMLNVRTEEERMTALLHDVVEDTDTTFEDLRRAGFSDTVIEAVRALTKHEGESREAAARRAVANPIARNVKLADVTDNMDLSRIPNPGEADLARLEEYKRVKDILLAGPTAASPKERKILYLDMDNVLVDFASAIPRLTRRERERYAGRLDDVPGIFARMDPVDGAVEAFRELAELYDAYILSTGPWDNPTALSDKLAWVKAHLGAACRKRLILSHNKHLNRGDFLVDDRPNNGAKDFEGELIVFGSQAFPDWGAVLP
ncbi:MAG TPA: HD domain-containing protein, partial [Woeseiaceae bacterium]|nr:HD domain-containing protein [Woeseiaceae bacterium]